MKLSLGELELLEHRIKTSEVSLSEMQDVILTLSGEMKETQKYLIKLAHSQAELTKRVSMWPYVSVAEKK